MKIYRTQFPDIGTPCVLALGTFDGVHLGHAAVIDRAVSAARSMSVPAAVWCFSDLPRNMLAPEPRTPLICTADDKLSLIAARGVDAAVCTDDAGILRLEAREFVSRLLAALSPLRVVVGFNYTFGARAAGSADTLRAMIPSVEVVPPVEIDGSAVSSTRIRELISGGGVSAASRLLGRPYSITSTGSRTQIPTVPPKSGQYRVLIRDNPSTVPRPAVAAVNGATLESDAPLGASVEFISRL